MKPVYAEFELINSGDLSLFRRGYLHHNDINQMKVKMCVNLKGSMLVINEIIQHQLQLQTLETRTFRMEDHSLVQLPVSSPVEVHFRNRRTICRAVVLPGNSEPALGFIPFLDMDIAIDPDSLELVVNPAHPNQAWVRL